MPSYFDDMGNEVTEMVLNLQEENISLKGENKALKVTINQLKAKPTPEKKVKKTDE